MSLHACCAVYALHMYVCYIWVHKVWDNVGLTLCGACQWHAMLPTMEMFLNEVGVGSRFTLEFDNICMGTVGHAPCVDTGGSILCLWLCLGGQRYV